MISFSTNGKKECTDVLCNVSFGTHEPSDKSMFSFTWRTNDPHYAYLLAKHFQQKFQSLVKEAHKKAYEIGYKDGKGKQRKKTNFDGFLGDKNPAY